MIKEDYCSYELSKLLKEKGFDTPCSGRYSIRSKDFHLDCTKMCNNRGLFECAAPTHQMAMKWLREKGFYIEIQTLFDEFEPSLLEFTNFHALITTIIDGRVIDETHLADEGIKDYGECVEFAINYCLTELVKGSKEWQKSI